MWGHRNCLQKVIVNPWFPKPWRWDTVVELFHVAHPSSLRCLWTRKQSVTTWWPKDCITHCVCSFRERPLARSSRFQERRGCLTFWHFCLFFSQARTKSQKWSRVYCKEWHLLMTSLTLLPFRREKEWRSFWYSVATTPEWKSFSYIRY